MAMTRSTCLISNPLWGELCPFFFLGGSPHRSLSLAQSEARGKQKQQENKQLGPGLWLMLNGAWLLADLDGTLLSTPHKAKGQYQSLEESPCFAVIKRWLLNGGSLCIVTTADTRVFDQVYAPLRSILRDADGRNGSGELLLSLYTGALLYRCTVNDVEVVREYTEAMHCATREAVELAELYGLPLKQVYVPKVGLDGTTRPLLTKCVKGTCFSVDTSRALLAQLEEIFISLLEKTLGGDRVFLAALEHLSARYKEMWRLLLGYLEAQCRRHGPPSASAAEAVAWKCDFLRQRRCLFTELGIIRVELAESPVLPLATTERNASEESTQLTSKCVSRSLDDDSELSRRFAREMILLLCPGSRCSHDDHDQVSGCGPQRNGDVAQVIFLGLPIRLFTCLFQRHFEAFARLGVTAMPQPNSVVFSKMGISKSTTIRYLVGPALLSGHAGVPRQQQRGKASSLRGVVNLTRAVAIGDNPHTTDYELTVFPRLPFVSVEIAAKRRRRHTRISASAVVQTTPRQGLLMDDRLLKNLLYVGGEEDGSAMFLTGLMDRLRVPSLGGTRREALGPSAEPATFASAVAGAAAEAFARMSGCSSHL
ncbi:uncharacterized protein Tco025E_06329 [Trypanosoma conorhini]|uniref:Uncharacterized protein n=1 Tax=Trypanosoma conorhini TaxID=83891 RepID=A0A3S5ISS2_9TRYP|nr:uncharacterized protein Tco025E_06329 [Trypanosoma conorhini]RNF13036.1 hypothetical protein Tco025E_06329 [Trypanosoma conorhini]